ncbi:MAG: SRPBCC family protein, partial [Hyphomicrobiales bacterium]
MDELGTFGRSGDQTTLRYERRYARPIETVWAALTTPERLADWLGPALVEPFVGGRFQLFIDRADDARMFGRVLKWEPPRLLEYTWKVGGERETTVRCELEPDGPNATRLVFIHSGMAFPWVGLVLPGWHTHFERLAKALDTSKAQPFSMDRWRELQALYLDRYGLEGVMLDPPSGHGG